MPSRRAGATRTLFLYVVMLSGLLDSGASARSAERLQVAAIPELTARVNDFAGVLDDASKTAIDKLSTELQAATGDVLIVATVKTRQPSSSIAAFAAEMFKNHGRGIGQRDRDNGLLIVLAVQDREVRIEVGLGLEKIISNALADQTIQETMIPVLKKGEFGAGLLAGARRLAQRLATARPIAAS